MASDKLKEPETKPCLSIAIMPAPERSFAYLLTDKVRFYDIQYAWWSYTLVETDDVPWQRKWGFLALD